MRVQSLDRQWSRGYRGGAGSTPAIRARIAARMRACAFSHSAALQRRTYRLNEEQEDYERGMSRCHFQGKCVMLKILHPQLFRAGGL